MAETDSWPVDGFLSNEFANGTSETRKVVSGSKNME
jgi:hypothetical protein